MSDPSLHWFIPSRRAVVRQTITYSDLLRAWLAALQGDGDALRRWYTIAAPNFQAGAGQILQWLQSAFGQESGVAVARDTVATLDLPSVPFFVRLWKGPLRVLLEREAKPTGPADEITNPKESQFEHDGQVKLNLNDHGEVTNTDARFLMGDVVEFPLFKFLAACGLSQFGGAPPYEDKLTFNGEGSFLLGTSLLGSDGVSPPTSPALHDNFVAMRFQMLFSGFRAAFYHLDQAVFVKHPRAIEAKSGKRTVYARGFIYASELARPNAAPPAGQPEHWRMLDYEWGVASPGKLAECVPTKAGLDYLSDDFVVTPGGTCSPTTLFLTNYMMRHYSKHYGGDSVGHTMNNTPSADITKTYQFVPKADIAALIPIVPEPEMQDRLKRLIEHCEKVLAVVDGEQSFMRQKLAAAQSWSEWETDVRPVIKKQLAAAVDHPARLIEVVRTGFTDRKTPAEESTVLERFHGELVAGAQAFGDALGGLLDAAEWADFTSVAPDFSGYGLKAAVQNVKSIKCPGGRCKQRHDFQSLETLRDNLRKKLKNLKQRRDSGKPLSGGPRSGTIDFSPHVSDVNSVSLDGHEWGIVRLYPHDKLRQAQQLPQSGFLAAYDPLDGTPLAGDPPMPQGQLYVFEEGDMLFQWLGDDKEKIPTRSACGAGPFRWERIEKNRCTIAVNGSLIHFGQGDRPRFKPLLGITKLRGQAAGSDPLADTHLQEPRAFRPFFVYPIRGASTEAGYRSAESRLVKKGMKLYASRALPFPTLLEVGDAFAPKSDVTREVDRLREAAAAALDQLKADLDDATKERDQLKKELQDPTKDKTKMDKNQLPAAERKINGLNARISHLDNYLKSLGGPPPPPPSAPPTPAP